jgi:coenzyme F420-0:L-glutamate ligase/coenzyme F420-1:gamma-L-glutamate ligase
VTSEYQPVSDVITSRRSVRRFSGQRVERAVVEELVALACAAPAPHGSRPWRFAYVASPEAREGLADAMADAWRADLEAEGRSVHEIAGLLERSRGAVAGAPALLLACLVFDQARPWPDERRRHAERDMFVQSLGAALQNILLGAEERGLSGYLKGAPLFCREAVSAALALPPGWEPAFLVLLGYREPAYQTPPRDEAETSRFMIER